MRLSNVTIVALLTASSAMADGFSVRDMGEISNRDDCMRRAEFALNAHTKINGGRVDVSDWVVYGWDVGPGRNDISFMCPWVNGDIINAFVVIHGDGDGSANDDVNSDNREAIGDALDALFN